MSQSANVPLPAAPDASAAELARRVARGEVTAEAVTRAALERVAALDPSINAFLETCPDYALARAALIDEALRGGLPAGPLAGVPIAVKDNICTAFARTTCASRMLREFRPPYSATVIERIEAAGGIVIGKTNCDEFAMGSSTENSGFQPTRNPWNPDFVPGGSSGGSAAAVAAGMVPLALGSDTGGSVRQPASFCGVVGLKPTYGRVSRYGLVAYGSSLDQVGPLAGTVEDAALMLSIIAGRDPRDSTSVDAQTPPYHELLGDAALAECGRRLRIGIPREYFGPGLDAEVRRALETAFEVYRGLGAQLVEVSLPHTKYAVSVYYLVATAEASSNLSRYDGVHYGSRTQRPGGIVEIYSRSRDEGFGPEVKRRIMLGAFALSAGYYDAYYSKALKVRRLIQNDFLQAFEACDLIACPAAPTPPFRFGEKTADPLQMYLADIYTIAANLAGIPGLSLPCGQSSAGLPIGLQLLGPILSEATLLQAGRLYERATEWHTLRPTVPAQAPR